MLTGANKEEIVQRERTAQLLTKGANLQSPDLLPNRPPARIARTLVSQLADSSRFTSDRNVGIPDTPKGTYWGSFCTTWGAHQQCNQHAQWHSNNAPAEMPEHPGGLVLWKHSDCCCLLQCISLSLLQLRHREDLKGRLRDPQRTIALAEPRVPDTMNSCSSQSGNFRLCHGDSGKYTHECAHYIRARLVSSTIPHACCQGHPRSTIPRVTSLSVATDQIQA